MYGDSGDPGSFLDRREFLLLSGASLAAVAVMCAGFPAPAQADGLASGPRFLIQFKAPDAWDARYSRNGQFHHIPMLPFTVEAALTNHRSRRVKDEASRARLVLLRGREQAVVAAGEWSDGPDYRLVLTEDPGNAKPLVLAAEVESTDAWVIAQPVYIGEPPPLDRPRWVATGAQRFRYSDLNFQGIGYVWYPGHRPESKGMAYAPRPGGQWSYRQSPSDFYVQRMTVATTTGDFYPEFLRDQSGHVGASFVETQYHQRTSHTPGGQATMLFRDGPRNVGSLAYPAGGFVDADESLVVASAPGRIARVDLTGHVTTLCGWRLKRDALAPRMARDDMLATGYEFVGTIVEGSAWAHIWDVQQDPDNPQHLYIADVSQQCIRKLALDSGELSVFAGPLDGSSGFVDGTAREARFLNPRGLAFRDGFLYVGDAANHAIRRIDMRTREVTTLVVSAERPMHHKLGDFETVREWAKDGAFGEARFMHPQHIKFTSDGCLITPMHHQLQLVEFDLEKQRVRTLHEDLPGARFRDHAETWMTLDIDDGSAGPKDTIYYNGWEHATDRMMDRQGKPVPGPFERSWIMQHRRSSQKMGHDARADYFRTPGYSQFTVCGKGALWVGGVAGAGIFRITPARPGDPVNYDHEAFERGMALWWRSPDPLTPSFSLIHGPWGINGYGEATVDDLGSLSRDAFRDWIYRDKGRNDLSQQDIDDLWYFVRMESISGKGFAQGA